jgi:hypothetical protein
MLAYTGLSGEVVVEPGPVEVSAGSSSSDIRSSATSSGSSGGCEWVRCSKEEIMPSTVQFHLVFRATPERVYRAFIDLDAIMKWLPPNGFTGKVHHLESHSFEGEYLAGETC